MARRALDFPGRSGRCSESGELSPPVRHDRIASEGPNSGGRMSESIQIRSTEEKNAGAAIPVGARIDAAHVLGSGSPAQEPAPSMLAETAPTSTDANVPAVEMLAHMRAQGRQLAQLLQERQQELDRREAQQHAQAAELENQMRAARVWLSARHQELSDREERAAAREREVADAGSRLSAAETYHDAARRDAEAELARRDGELMIGRAELDRWRSRLESQAAAQQAAQREFTETRQQEHDRLVLARQQLDSHHAASMTLARQSLAALEQRRVAIEQQATVVERRRAELVELACRPSPEQIRMARANAETADRLAAREEQLAAAEQLQVHAEAELIAIRRDLDADREELAQEARSERRRLVESQRMAAAEIDQQREALARQRQQLDETQVNLERMRAELSELHQTALESRLVAEETLIQLSGTAAPATVIRALAESRERISDHWRLAAGRVADERAALAKTQAELVTQSKKLVVQRHELAAWMERRQAEFGLQARALANREEELREWERTLRIEREQWNGSRLAFEQQLRNAAARLREATGDHRATA